MRNNIFFTILKLNRKHKNTSADFSLSFVFCQLLMYFIVILLILSILINLFADIDNETCIKYSTSFFLKSWQRF